MNKPDPLAGKLAEFTRLTKSIPEAEVKLAKDKARLAEIKATLAETFGLTAAPAASSTGDGGKGRKSTPSRFRLNKDGTSSHTVRIASTIKDATLDGMRGTTTSLLLYTKVGSDAVYKNTLSQMIARGFVNRDKNGSLTLTKRGEKALADAESKMAARKPAPAAASTQAPMPMVATGN